MRRWVMGGVGEGVREWERYGAEHARHTQPNSIIVPVSERHVHWRTLAYAQMLLLDQHFIIYLYTVLIFIEKITKFIVEIFMKCSTKEWQY